MYDTKKGNIEYDVIFYNTKGINLGMVPDFSSYKKIHRGNNLEIYAEDEKYFLKIYKIFFSQIDTHNGKIWLFGNINRNWSYSFLHQFVLTPLMEVLFRIEGYFSLHSAAVSKGRESILILGDSGTGKTLNSLLFLKKGYKFLGDDTIFIDKNGVCFPFLKPIHLSKNHNNFLQFPLKNLPDYGKKSVFVGDLLAENQIEIRGREIKKLFFLKKINEKQTHFQPMHVSEVFKKILSYSFIPLGKHNDKQMKIIEKISTLPAFEVSLKRGEFLYEKF